MVCGNNLGDEGKKCWLGNGLVRKAIVPSSIMAGERGSEGIPPFSKSSQDENYFQSSQVDQKGNTTRWANFTLL